MAPRRLENKKEVQATGGVPVTLTWEAFQRICANLALSGSKYKACEANNFKYDLVQKTIRAARERGDEEWGDLWEASYDEFRDRLEQAAITRHVDGVEQNRYDKDGKLISTEIVYSDRMGELLLKGHFPERYRDKIFVSGTVGLEPVDVFANLTPRAKREIRAIVMRDLEEQRQAARLEADEANGVIEGSSTLVSQLEDLRAGTEEDEE